MHATQPQFSSGSRNATLTLQQAIQLANDAYNSRDWARAEQLCRSVLGAEPDCFDVLNLLGAITAQTRRSEEAAALLSRAVALKPDSAQALNNLGNTLKELGQLEAAVASYDRAIAAMPDHKDAYACFNCGVALEELGRLAAAVASYNRAVEIKPDYADAHFNRGCGLYDLRQLEAAVVSFERAIGIKPDYAQAYVSRGVALRELRQLVAAVDSYDCAIAIDPGSVKAYNNRGVALCDLHQLEAAVDSFDRAIAIKPDYAEAYSNRSVALKGLSRLDAAVASCDRAIAIKPDYAQAWCNRGVVLKQLNRHEEAVASYDRAIALDPGYAEPWSNRGFALQDMRRLDEALASYERAIAIRPDCAEAQWNLASFRLLRGDFVRGWAGYEWRWKTEQSSKDTRKFAQPLWLGKENLAGTTILLCGEQGLGDTLQFCRYVKLVAGLGARVVLEVQAPLRSLLAGLEGAALVLARGAELPAFDFHCPLMSLPLALGTELASVPADIPYIQSDPVRAAKWRERLGKKTKPRIGLVWNGGFRANQPTLWDINERRNVPFEKIATLRLPQLDFFSLQKGEPAESELAKQKQGLWPEENFYNHAADLYDFSETAALIENLDLVITVDTSTAHLAGAMGKPVWILNRFDTCWRWMLEREDSPWYPTAKLYRQQRPGDWDGVLERVKADLAGL